MVQSAEWPPGGENLPVMRSAIAGAWAFGALFLAFWIGAEVLGLLGPRIFIGLWAIGLYLSLTLGAGAGAFAAWFQNLLGLLDRCWPTGGSPPSPT